MAAFFYAFNLIALKGFIRKERFWEGEWLLNQDRNTNDVGYKSMGPRASLYQPLFNCGVVLK